MLQYVVVRCSVWQYVAVCYMVCYFGEAQLFIRGRHARLVCCGVLQCVAVCCSVLQCVALSCIVLHCVAVCGSVFQYVDPLALTEGRDMWHADFLASLDTSPPLIYVASPAVFQKVRCLCARVYVCV